MRHQETNRTGEGAPMKVRRADQDDDLHLKKEVTIGGYQVTALIDPGATGCLISPRVVEKHKLPYRNKATPVRVEMADGTFSQGYGKGWLRLETTPLPVGLDGLWSQHSFTIMDLGSLEAIISYN